MARKLIFEKHQNIAIEKIENLMSTRHGSQRLTTPELVENFPHAIAGWSIKLHIGETVYDAYLVISQYFPYTLPSVFVPLNSPLKNKPHVESNGKLCLEAGYVTFAHRRPADIVDYLLKRAEQCLALSMDQAQKELLEEFNSYWDRQGNISLRQASTLIRREGPSRKIFYFDGEKQLLFGDSIEQVQRWIKNLTSGSNSMPQVRSTALIWLDEPMLPAEFPETSKALADLIKLKSRDGYAILAQVLPRDHSSISILIGFRSDPENTILAAVSLSEPTDVSLQNGKMRVKSNLFRGFREKKMPASILADRFLGSTPIIPSITRRVDSSWIHARGGSGRESVFDTNKHVVIIGCGSLGAALAVGLAKSGISKLTLIDGDVLTVDNVARHVLGVGDVGPPKETGLMNMLQGQLPHAEIMVYPGRRWQDVYSSTPENILKSDLIISTTGTWGCDEPLNAVVRSHADIPPTIFGWLEPFGCAGHALVITMKGGCLSCGMDEYGNFSKSATLWPNETMIRAGRCGEFFQPYTLLEAMQTQAMLIRLALDTLEGKVVKSTLRTWIGKLTYLTENGGMLAPAFANQASDIRDGGVYLEYDWASATDCPLCNGT